MSRGSGNGAVESKSDKFERIATRRVGGILQSLEVLGNCSGAGYEFTEEQVIEMFDAINRATEKAQAKFLPKTRDDKRKAEFAFSAAGEIGA